jgi:hypothetical protein
MGIEKFFAALSFDQAKWNIYILVSRALVLGHALLPLITELPLLTAK